MKLLETFFIVDVGLFWDILRAPFKATFSKFFCHGDKSQLCCFHTMMVCVFKNTRSRIAISDVLTAPTELPKDYYRASEIACKQHQPRCESTLKVPPLSVREFVGGRWWCVDILSIPRKAFLPANNAPRCPMIPPHALPFSSITVYLNPYPPLY